MALPTPDWALLPTKSSGGRGRLLVKGTTSGTLPSGTTPAAGGDDSGGGGGGGGSYSAQMAALQARQNDNTRALVEGQAALLASFAKARDTKIGNITRALASGDALLLENYGRGRRNLDGNIADNDAAQSDLSFGNLSNLLRERQDILGELANNGAGETDQLRAQLQALRNFTANQNEANRSYFDTYRSIQNAISSLNSDTASSRLGLFNQAESDIESTWANYNNQEADTWTQIMNIENANTNDTYGKMYGNAGASAAAAVANAYSKKEAPADWLSWNGRAEAPDRQLVSSNKAATVNLGAAPKKPEGATLRKW